MGVGHSVRRTLKLTVTQEWIDRGTNILHFGANSGKLKVMSILFGCAWSEMGMAIEFRRP